MLSSGVPRPRVSAFHHSASALPHSNPLSHYSGVGPFQPHHWESERLGKCPRNQRDGEIHKGSLPQSILSQKQRSLLNTASYHAYASVKRLWGPQAHAISTHKMCLNPLQGGEKVCVSEGREYLKLVAGGLPLLGNSQRKRRYRQKHPTRLLQLQGWAGWHPHNAFLTPAFSYFLAVGRNTRSKYSSLCIRHETGMTIPVICTLQNAPQIFGSSK